MKKIIYIFICFIFLIFTSCKNDEKIPAYICVDSLFVSTNYITQGTNSHAIKEYWLSVNHKPIGIFEPNSSKTIPILDIGKQTISLSPGILENSSSSYHADYLMMQSFTLDTVLVAGEVYHFTPVFKYFDNIKFALLENFDGEGNKFEISENSVPMTIEAGDASFEGKSMSFALEDSTAAFECKSVGLLVLPKQKDCYLEVNYRCNGLFSFGIFDKHSSSGGIIETRKNVFIFRSSENEWRKVYVNLKTHLSDCEGSEFRPYFFCSKANNKNVEKVEVCIDNVKILYR